MGGLWEGAEIISVVTRRELLDEGDLVDVTETAQDLFKLHTAVTRRVWNEVITPPDAVSAWQDHTGRLWDVLWMLQCAVTRNKLLAYDLDTIIFKVLVQNTAEEDNFLTVKLKGVISGGDDGAAVLTILMPEED